MPKISDLDYVSEIDATSYLLGVKGGSTVRFPASVLQGEAPVVNTTFISQGDTPTSYVGQTGKLAAVNAAEDALEFIAPPTSLPVGGTTGQVLTKQSAADGDADWQAVGGMGLPQTPVSFSAKHTSTFTTTSQVEVAAPYTTIIKNIGSCYNATTSIFTAPINGLYYFHASVYFSSAIYWDLSLVSSTGQRISNVSKNSSDYCTNRVNGLLHLVAGETVNVRIYTNPAFTLLADSSGKVRFQGCLIPDSYDSTKQIVDLTNATSDYLLCVGDTAKITYTSATSVPLHIATEEGVYDVEIVGSTSGYSSTSDAYLKPNNLTTATCICRKVERKLSTTAVTEQYASADGGLWVGAYLVNLSKFSVYTNAQNKIVKGFAVTSYSAVKDYAYDFYSIWNDTTTVWSSLGTITFPYAQSGTIIIKRIA